MSEIKPCPFCGSTDIKLHDEISHVVWCQECFAEVPSIDIESAIKLWNTRPIEDALQARIAELNARIAELEAEIGQLTAHDATERQDDKWIPVLERLPKDKFEHVLVCTTYGVGVRLALEIGEAVTHWMPLPNPPIVYGRVNNVSIL